MRKIITGYMEPTTDIGEIDSASGKGTDRTDVAIWTKDIIGNELPVKVTIEIDKRYLSDHAADRLSREGWTS